MSSPKGAQRAARDPQSLKAMQVDLTTRMGALTKATTTGISALDDMLSGGLRSGTLLSVASTPGLGRSAFALFLAYMAARARSAVLLAAPALDETEVMARLAARALHREWLDSNTAYPEIWSGKAWQSQKLRGPLGQAVDTVVSKVGQHLYLYRPSAFESTSVLAGHVQALWTRHESVVLVVDDVEVLSVSAGGDLAESQTINASFDNRVSQVAYELLALANGGAAVIVSVQKRHEQLVAPAATLSLTLCAEENAERSGALVERRVELDVTKNRIGNTGRIPLRFIPGAAVFEQVT